mmetsp:Transcript_6805/g.12291  ORF Transcript_6805/g.12291 Transcript_6805/m.12291 type:complete len:645 (+) Transcript_6805:1942-3876(+)
MRKVAPSELESNILTTVQSEDEVERQALVDKKKTYTFEDYLLLKSKLSIGEANKYKYLDVWRRALFRIKVRKVLSWVGDEIVKFGTSSEFIDINDNFKLNVDEILWKKQNKKEKFRQLSDNSEEKLPWNLVHPESNFMKGWNIVLTLILFYTAAIMPIRVAFYDVVFFDAWTIIDLMMDALFAFDIFVNCVVTYEKRDGSLERCSRKVICSYARTWMAFDVLACLPFSFIEFKNEEQDYDSSRANRYNQLIRLLRVPRLYKLLRILRIAKAFKNYRNNTLISQLQDYLRMNSRVYKFIKFLATVLFCVHIMGCIWFLTARIDGFTPDSWVVRRGILDADVGVQYLNSIYWAFTTLTTVGYGDISAESQIEMVIAVCWMIFGVGFYSFTIGSLSSFLSTIDTRDSLLNEKLAATNEFAKETGISERCKKKITSAVKYSTIKSSNIWNDKHQLFNELPKDLRYEVALSMYSGVAHDLPFFKGKDKAFVVYVMPLLKPSAVLNGEYLYREGEFPCEVYFIVKGRVNLVIGKSEIAYKSFLKGSYIGEVELIMMEARLDNCQAFGDSEFLVMQKEDFANILEEFPSEAKEIKRTAREKYKRNRKAKQELTALLLIKTEVGTLDVLAGKQNFLKVVERENSDCSDKEEQ